MFIFAVLSFVICALSTAPSFADGDRCEVTITDLNRLQKYMQEEWTSGEAPSAKVLGSFTTTVGEERMTTQHFVLPLTGERITASVSYTDESIQLVRSGTEMIFDVSIQLGLFISRKQVDSAFGHEGALSSQANYSKETLWVRTTKIIKHGGRRYAVSLGCFCNGARNRE